MLSEQVAELEKKNKQLLILLRKCQWGNYMMHSPSGTAMRACPICERPASPEYGGHTFDCELRRVLEEG